MGKINVDNLLPFGEKLKPLLNKACITEGDMKNILADRGLFICDSDKSVVIPQLTYSILSPKEFETLQELQKEKEDSVKMRTINYETSSQEKLNIVLKANTLETFKVKEDSDNYDLITDMSLQIENADTMVVEYKLERQDITKDWVSTKSEHIGRVEIEKKNNNIRFYNQFTSSETEKVNKKIIKHISETMKSGGFIDNKSAIEIKSDMFNNRQRFNFMLAMLSDSTHIQFRSLKNLEIGLDRTVKINDEIKWIGKEVKNIIINSEDKETLRDIEYIKNDAYYDFLKIRTIKALFWYDIEGAKGSCIIEFGFPHFFRKYTKTKTFQMSVVQLYLATENKEHSNRLASVKILSEFDNIVQEAMHSVLDTSEDC